MVWIRFSGLNVMFYDESAMKTIASAVGRPVKIDLTTKTAERGKFARACIELDLSVPVKRKVWIEDHFHEVEFESLHLICSRCDCYGHLARDCVKEVPTTEHRDTVPENPNSNTEGGSGEVQISRDKADTILEGSKSVSNHKQDTEKKAENQDWILVERRKKNNGRNKDMGKDFQYADKG